jgi:hypothetical protein
VSFFFCQGTRRPRSTSWRGSGDALPMQLRQNGTRASAARTSPHPNAASQSSGEELRRQGPRTKNVLFGGLC